MDEKNITSSAYPTIVFIIPYRNRPQHKYFFLNYMTQTVIADKYPKEQVEFYFAHQHDRRTFNRGAMKNIGFSAVREKYPDDYKKITFVFNDVDTIPFADIFDYETIPGVVKHFYGFNYALGGIVAISGADFERINGFPNYWGWGMEDKVIQDRCLAHHLKIDRSQFFSIGSPEILQLFDGVERLINPSDMNRSGYDSDNISSLNGLASISLLKYKIANGDASSNKSDNIHVASTNLYPVFFINTTCFLTSGSSFEKEKNKMMHYDLRAGANQMAKNYIVESSNFVGTTNTWKNIPNFPTQKQQQQLYQQLGKERAKQLISQMYYKSNQRPKPSHIS